MRPAAVTWYSCIASSSAAWVFGGVRLISSARMICAKIGPLHEPQPARRPPILVQYLGPGDVGRHQIGRELDPLELEIEDLRQGLDQQRLGEAWHTCDEAVAAGQEGNQDLLDGVVLPDNHLAELGEGSGARASAIFSAIPFVSDFPARVISVSDDITDYGLQTTDYRRAAELKFGPTRARR